MKKIFYSALIIVYMLLVISCDKKTPTPKPKVKEVDPYQNASFRSKPLLEISNSASVYLLDGNDKYLMGKAKHKLYFWDWMDLNAEPLIVNTGGIIPEDVCFAGLDDYVIANIKSSNGYSIQKKNIIENNIMHEWEHKKVWFTSQWPKNSNNGKFSVICQEEDSAILDKINSPRDAWTAHRRIGIINNQTNELNWILIIPSQDELPIINRVNISEGGSYVAAVGTKDGGWILVADVQKKQKMWERVPDGDEVPEGDWTINFNDVCFTPDGSKVFVAGNMGIFCFETLTGKILSQWPIPSRPVSIDVSPDGRLVAGGCGPGGTVYIFEVATGKPLEKLNTKHRVVYSVVFSPDSKLLAIEGGGKAVQIWQMPKSKEE